MCVCAVTIGFGVTQTNLKPSVIRRAVVIRFYVAAVMSVCDLVEISLYLCFVYFTSSRLAVKSFYTFLQDRSTTP